MVGWTTATPTQMNPIYELSITRQTFFGPNNQIHGLRESIILAVKLNRTLVIPPFYKHHTIVKGKQ